MEPPRETGRSRQQQNRRAAGGVLALLVVTCATALLAGLIRAPFSAEAATPEDLTNFQNEYPCDNSTVRIVRWGTTHRATNPRGGGPHLPIRARQPHIQIGGAEQPGGGSVDGCGHMTAGLEKELPTAMTNSLPLRPRNVGDIQAAVKLHSKVQASGEGHSWNQVRSPHHMVCTCDVHQGGTCGTRGHQGAGVPPGFH